MGIKRKKYCVTCRYENVHNRKPDNTDGIAIWCNYKNEYINNTKRQSVWCQNWKVHENFKHEEFEDTLSKSNARSEYNTYKTHEKTFKEKVKAALMFFLFLVFSALSLIYLIIFIREINYGFYNEYIIVGIFFIILLSLAIYFFTKWTNLKD